MNRRKFSEPVKPVSATPKTILKMFVMQSLFWQRVALQRTHLRTFYEALSRTLQETLVWEACCCMKKPVLRSALLIAPWVCIHNILPRLQEWKKQQRHKLCDIILSCAFPQPKLFQLGPKQAIHVPHSLDKTAQIRAAVSPAFKAMSWWSGPGLGTAGEIFHPSLAIRRF